MTAEEEEQFRIAARKALPITQAIGLIYDDGSSIEAFTVVYFSGYAHYCGIILPAEWEGEPDLEERLHGILREESRRIAGQLAD